MFWVYRVGVRRECDGLLGAMYVFAVRDLGIQLAIVTMANHLEIWLVCHLEPGLPLGGVVVALHWPWLGIPHAARVRLLYLSHGERRRDQLRSWNPGGVRS